jgi:hypothetical protein
MQMKMTKMSAKWVASLAVLGGSLGGVANAGPMTWTDYHNFTPDRLVTILSPVVYTHNIADSGFVPGVSQVNSYSLSFNLYDDKDKRGEREIALFSQPGELFSDIFFNLSGNEGGGWSFAGIWQLEHTGRLTVAISSLLGDFYLGSSTLTVKGSHSVPEPGTLALFGASLLGFGLIRRKRITG